MNPDFWAGKRIFLTGHTGFKGAWAYALLKHSGAEVYCLSLPPEGDPNLWNLLKDDAGTDHLYYSDIRDGDSLKQILLNIKPDIVISFAAQSLVRRSYKQPLETFEINIMGTARLLEALRYCDNLKAVLVATSDKVYKNNEAGELFNEDSPLGGDDPYSASKAGCEIMVASLARSFFASRGIPVATARSGNVIGGGDWSQDRLVPDIYRSIIEDKPLVLRHPKATRPWQHVLDCLNGYFTYIETLLTQSGGSAPLALNFGPKTQSLPNVEDLAASIYNEMGHESKIVKSDEAVAPEKQSLALDSSLSSEVLGWEPLLNMDHTIAWTTNWYGRFARGESAKALVDEQIKLFVDKMQGSPG